jgi:hypothetical protein
MMALSGLRIKAQYWSFRGFIKTRGAQGLQRDARGAETAGGAWRSGSPELSKAPIGRVSAIALEFSTSDYRALTEAKALAAIWLSIPDNSLILLAGEEGLEPPTPGFGDRCSNQLSYTPTRELLASTG